LLIYLDFDGTVVEHAYPEIGSENPGATDVIRALQNRGHEIILNSFRADLNDGSLELAFSYLNSEDAALSEIIQFEPKKITPSLYPDTLNKSSVSLFLDDTAPNTPLRPNLNLPHGSMVDWRIIKRDLLLWGLISE
jgi:hypothetical protein